jgi:hypothetical protein
MKLLLSGFTVFGFYIPNCNNKYFQNNNRLSIYHVHIRLVIMFQSTRTYDTFVVNI